MIRVLNEIFIKDKNKNTTLNLDHRTKFAVHIDRIRLCQYHGVAIYINKFVFYFFSLEE